MAEKRRSKYTIVIRREGSRQFNKLELYPYSLWGKLKTKTPRFRLRFNGKWFPEKGKHNTYYSVNQISNLIKDALNESLK